MSRINRLSASPVASVAMGVLLVLIVVYLFVHDSVFGWLPSLFRDALIDKAYLYASPWVRPDEYHTFHVAFAIYVVWFLVWQTFDGVYRVVRRHPWVPLLLPLVFLGLLVARDVYTGYAIYGDRIAMRAPFGGQAVKTYAVSDIARVEIGCKKWKENRGTNVLYPRPIYRVVFKDGVTIAPFDLTYSHLDPKLMTAVLQFDRAAQTAGISRIYWQSTTLDPMRNHSRCFDAWEANFRPELRPAMRQTFMLNGQGVRNP